MGMKWERIFKRVVLTNSSVLVINKISQRTGSFVPPKTRILVVGMNWCRRGSINSRCTSTGTFSTRFRISRRTRVPVRSSESPTPVTTRMRMLCLAMIVATRGLQGFRLMRIMRGCSAMASFSLV